MREKSVHPEPADQELQVFWFDSLHPSQQFFSHVRTGFPGLNQY